MISTCESTTAQRLNSTQSFLPILNIYTCISKKRKLELNGSRLQFGGFTIQEIPVSINDFRRLRLIEKKSL